jgi:hypothetical protein
MSFASYEEDMVREHCGLSPRHEPGCLAMISWLVVVAIIVVGMVAGIGTAIDNYRMMQDKVMCLSSLSVTPPPVCVTYGYPTGRTLEQGNRG